MTGFTLDTGALIALERAEERVTALLHRVLATPDAVIHIPAGVLAQAFRGGTRQARLARLLKHPQTSIVPLALIAQVIGLLLGALILTTWSTRASSPVPAATASVLWAMSRLRRLIQFS